MPNMPVDAARPVPPLVTPSDVDAWRAAGGAPDEVPALSRGDRPFATARWVCVTPPRRDHARP